MKTAILAAAVLGVSTLAAAPAPAQPVAPETRFDTTTLDISATGEVHVAPDMATITLGVSNTAPTAAEAMAATNAAMAKVVAAVKAVGVEERWIQTTGINLSPQYVYAQNQPPKLTGYQANNDVSVSVLDLARLGPVADAVVAAGATNIGSISFGLKTRTTAENDARLAAVKALDDKAALYANAAGYHIKRLVTLTEGSSVTPIRPMPMARMMAGAEFAVPTTVETVQLAVSVSITGEFELTH